MNKHMLALGSHPHYGGVKGGGLGLTNSTHTLIGIISLA